MTTVALILLASLVPAALAAALTNANRRIRDITTRTDQETP